MENTLTVTQYQNGELVHLKGEDAHNSSIEELFKTKSDSEIKDGTFVINSQMERYSIPGVRTKLALNRMLIVLKDESGMRYFEAGASGNNPYPLVIAQTSLKEIEGEEFRFHLSDNLKEKFNAELVGIELFNKLDNDLSNNANLPRRIKI